jgi:hypothetical protein
MPCTGPGSGDHIRVRFARLPQVVDGLALALSVFAAPLAARIFEITLVVITQNSLRKDLLVRPDLFYPDSKDSRDHPVRPVFTLLS